MNEADKKLGIAQYAKELLTASVQSDRYFDSNQQHVGIMFELAALYFDHALKLLEGVEE